MLTSICNVSLYQETRAFMGKTSALKRGHGDLWSHPQHENCHLTARKLSSCTSCAQTCTQMFQPTELHASELYCFANYSLEFCDKIYMCKDSGEWKFTVLMFGKTKHFLCFWYISSKLGKYLETPNTAWMSLLRNRNEMPSTKYLCIYGKIAMIIDFCLF